MLQSLKASVRPREVSQRLLANIENKRVREVLEKRFGLKNGPKKTLDAIGKEYGITRERVRQIEADGLRVLAVPAIYSVADSAFKALKDHLDEHGGVAADEPLLQSVADEKDHPHVSFLLTVGKAFQKKPETDGLHPAWFTNKTAHETVSKILEGVYRDLDTKKIPVAKDALLEMIAVQAERVLGSRPRDSVVRNFLGMAKSVAENPYGEYGLISWSTIRPKGVRDKAYLVLQKAGKPLHFREVARIINSMNWVKKAAHPQTVHNELIKAGDRFVLVGRGLYALREWGYTPGTVAEVISGVIKEAGKPMSKEDLIRRVFEKRFVKENTILLNLQNRSLFRKGADGKYFLA